MVRKSAKSRETFVVVGGGEALLYNNLIETH